jgi:flavodoxin
MNTVIVYASRTGNTQKVAEAIADGLSSLGAVRTTSTDEADPTSFRPDELLVIGGPTEGHGMNEPMVAFLDKLFSVGVAERPVAVFDTRLWWPRWMSGSAADKIAERLEHGGAELVLPPESFIVTMKPVLQPGELERARAWGAELAAAADRIAGAVPRAPVGAASS